VKTRVDTGFFAGNQGGFLQMLSNPGELALKLDKEMASAATWMKYEIRFVPEWPKIGFSVYGFDNLTGKACEHPIFRDWRNRSQSVFRCFGLHRRSTLI
jgi:hypothetical protein